MGWARQPGRRTVEGEIRAGLARQKIARRAEELRLDVASRTDRGVHARANALALDSELEGPALLRALNGVAPDIFFTHARRIPETFRPRRALARRYRYFEPLRGDSVERWRALLAAFEGRVDVRSFGRGLTSPTPVWREVLETSVSRDGALLIAEIRAPSFVWGMVRKMVGSVRAAADGRLAEADLRAAIAGEKRLTVALAEPERLVLWEVEYPGIWEFTYRPDSGRAARNARRALDASAVRAAVVSGLWEWLPAPTGQTSERPL